MPLVRAALQLCVPVACGLHCGHITMLPAWQLASRAMQRGGNYQN